MPNLEPQYAFVAGEISKEFFGRTDLVKYSLGAQLVHNFTVGYRGGLYSRAGSRMIGQIQHDDKPVKLFRFRSTTDDYVLLFGDLYMRVVRNGGYLLEAAKTVTAITQAAPGVLTAASHGYSTGDWVYVSAVAGMTEVNGRYFEVGATATNTIELLLPDGTNLDTSGYTAYSSGGTVQRVYTLVTPYAAEDLDGLSAEQEYNTVTLTSLDYAERALTYVTDTSWTLTLVSFGASVTAPGMPTLTPSASASAGIAFSITAVVDGAESLPSPYGLTETSVDYSNTAGSMKVTWTAVAGADWYNVYRSLILPDGGDISQSEETGYIGRARSTQFIDTNIIPDFTKTPPRGGDPFADGAITDIEVTAAGSSYAKADTVSVTGGGGSGFVGYPVVDEAGTILSVVIISGGSGYASPTVSFTTSTGSGATATATVGPTSGNYPRIYKKFQQRGVRAGSTNYPMTVWGSKPGEPNNMDVSVNVHDGDAYSYSIDAGEVKPISHMAALRVGLLVFTAASVTLLKAQEGRALSPVNALAEPQVYKGVGDAAPVQIGLDVLFAQDLGSALNAMMYTEYTNSFTLQNVSALSPHLLGKGKKLLRLEFAEEPDKLLYCLREDGALLTVTYDRVEEVFGWAQHHTKGLYKDCVAVTENEGWSLYAVVERYINGAWVKFIERTLPRAADLAEDYWCVDCGLAYAHEYPAATLTVAAATGVGVTATASASVFTAGDVGKIIYSGKGKMEIVGYTSGTEIEVDILRDITHVLPESDENMPLPVLANAWSMAEPTTTVGNLWHLEGETVSVLADGDGFKDFVVTDGAIELDNAASKIIVGLPYKCKVKSLPVSSTQVVLDSRRLNIVGVGLKLYASRGLAVGDDFSRLVEMKDRSDEDWGEEIALRYDSTYVSVNAGWAEEAVIVAEQSYPLPATILSLVYETEAGDD